jgi:hypothetical protein
MRTAGQVADVSQILMALYGKAPEPSCLVYRSNTSNFLSGEKATVRIGPE